MTDAKQTDTITIDNVSYSLVERFHYCDLAVSADATHVVKIFKTDSVGHQCENEADLLQEMHRVHGDELALVKMHQNGYRRCVVSRDKEQEAKTASCLFLVNKPGRDLIVYAGKHGAMDEAMVRRTFDALGRSLVKLHTGTPRVALLDIKPDNILVEADGSAPCWCDLAGAISLADGQVHPSYRPINFGPMYAAPEAWDIKSAEPFCPFAADVWSFAMCVYSLSANRPAYTQPSSRCAHFVSFKRQLDAGSIKGVPKAVSDFLCFALKFRVSERPDMTEVMQHAFWKAST